MDLKAKLRPFYIAKMLYEQTDELYYTRASAEAVFRNCLRSHIRKMAILNHLERRHL